MKKILELLKKHYELIGYSLLTILLFGSCFSRVFALVTAVYIFIFAFLLHSETKIIALAIFFKCFSGLFSTNNFLGQFNVANVVIGELTLAICLFYLIRVIKKEIKINWKLLISLGVFLVYLILPFHEWSWRDLFAEISFYAILYVVFETRQEIDCLYLINVFIVGLIISCGFSLLRGVSPYLSQILPVTTVHKKFRFQGLFEHPNLLAVILVGALSGLLFMKYKNKINLVKFLVYFIPLFIFGYLTLARLFVLNVAVALIIFAIFELIQHKTKVVPLLLVLVAVVGSVSLICFDQTKFIISRGDEGVTNYINTGKQGTGSSGSQIVTNPSSPYHSGVLKGKTEEWAKKVFAGEVRFDPGRKGFYELYFMDWSSSPKIIWFGRGISRPNIGRMNAHNQYLYFLWQHGIVGCIFFGVVILSIVKWKNLKTWKQYLPILILLIPYFLITLIEVRVGDYSLITLILAAGNLLQQKSDKDLDDNNL